MKKIIALALLALLIAAPANAQIAISALPSASTPLSGVELVPIVQGGVTKNAPVAAVRGNSNVTVTGGPTSGNLTRWSSGTSLTNGNLAGDCTTSGALVVTCTKTNGVSYAPSATTDTTNATNVSSGTLGSGRLPLATNAAIGGMRGDGSTLTCTAGVCSSISGGSGTVTSVTCGTGLSGGTIVVSGTCAVAPISLATGSSTGNTLTGPAEIFVCTATCTVTPPAPVAGYQFCVENDATTSGVITMGGNTSVFYQKAVAPGVANGYGSSGGTMTSGGVVGDSVCIIGRDSTHYLVGAFGGTWVNS